MKPILQYVPDRKARILITVALVAFAVAAIVYDTQVKAARDKIVEMVPVAIQKSQEGLDRLQNEPVVKKLMDKINPAVEEAMPEIEIAIGATEAEVEKLLGKPSGTISAPDRSIWVYGDRRIEFMDGVVFSSSTIAAKSEDPEEGSIFDPLEQSVKSNLKKAEGWASDVAGDMGLVKRDIVVLGKDGVPTHQGSVVSDGEKPLTTKMKEFVSGKETAIVLRKVQEDDHSFKGDVYEQRTPDKSDD
jgi:hypothetical protein